jgi:hypothetical protein
MVICLRKFEQRDDTERLCIDSITEITFSKSFGALDRGDEFGLIALSKVVFSSAAWVGIIPWLYRIHHYVSPITGNWLGVTMRSIRFRAVTEQKVKEHKVQDENHKDILGYLEDVRRQKPDEYSEYGLVSTLTSNVFAGSDTTAIALRAMIWYLLSSPAYHERFVRELKERQESGLISDPITFQQAESWPFLQGVMYEALRLHPPFAVHLPRVVPDGGLVADGHFIPSGVSCGSNTELYCSHTDRTDGRWDQCMGDSSQQGSFWRRRGQLPTGAMAGSVNERRDA